MQYIWCEGFGARSRYAQVFTSHRIRLGVITYPFPGYLLLAESPEIIYNALFGEFGLIMIYECSNWMAQINIVL